MLFSPLLRSVLKSYPCEKIDGEGFSDAFQNYKQNKNGSKRECSEPLELLGGGV